MTKIFDTYDMQARLSVVIILVTPVLLALYLQVESIRNIASTVIVTVALLALSNLLVLFVRFHGRKKHQKRDLVVEYLYPSNSKIEPLVKERLYSFLKTVDDSFAILYDEKDRQEVSAAYSDACKSALNWLKEHARDSGVVNKESAMYGFCRNLLGVKPAGIAISTMMILLHGIQFATQYNRSVSLATPEFLVSFAAAVLYLFLWIFLAREKLLKFCADNYAEALIRSFDKLIQVDKTRRQ